MNNMQSFLKGEHTFCATGIAFCSSLVHFGQKVTGVGNVNRVFVIASIF